MESLLVPAVDLAARLITGAILIIAGVAKLRSSPLVLQNAVLAMDLLPAWVASATARLLPPAEVALGILLVAGLFSWITVPTAFALIFALTTVVVVALASGRSFVCRCLGVASNSRWAVAYRNVALLAALAVAYAADPSWRMDALLPFAAPGAEWVSRTLIFAVIASACAVALCRLVNARDVEAVNSPSYAGSTQGDSK